MSEISPAEALFFAALEKTDPTERAAFLDAACPDDPDLKERVKKLLSAHERAGEFLPSDVTESASAETEGYDADDAPTLGSKRSTLDGGPRLEPPSDFIPGRVVAGRYTLLEVLGEGGWGRSTGPSSRTRSSAGWRSS